jgi:hypothetical protein
VALEACDGDAPDNPAAPALLDYADALGKATERLADSKVLPNAAQTPRAVNAHAARLPPDQSALPAGTTHVVGCPVIPAIMSKSPS